MSIISRWLAPLVIAAGISTLALAPTSAHAGSDDLVDVLVEVADVVLRGDQPYYRDDDRRYDNRSRRGRDNRYNSRNHRRGSSYGNRQGDRKVKCDKHGKCKVKTKSTYYDPRYDRKHRGYRYRD